MPVFATFLGSLFTALFTGFAQFMSAKLALKLAGYTAWLTIYTALLASVYVCANSLYGMVGGLLSGGGGGGGGGGGWLAYFFMGVGMFIPANAGAVISCIGGVWIATGIYGFQKDALLHFGA
jgi:hypothetical protein